MFSDWWAASQTNSAQDVGWLIGQYAIGTIGVAQEQNPTTIVHGQLAVRGTSLVVRWKYFLLILFALGAVQLIIFVFAVLFSNSVVVKDDSRLAIARLLRRMFFFYHSFLPAPLYFPAQSKKLTKCISNRRSTRFRRMRSRRGRHQQNSPRRSRLRGPTIGGVASSGSRAGY